MRYKEFKVTGVASETEYDGGLTSTEVEPKRLEAILICVELYAGNHIEGWLGTKQILGAPDYIFDTFNESAADTPAQSTTKIIRLQIGEDIPVGETFKIGIRCALTDTDIYGSYEYTIIGA